MAVPADPCERLADRYPAASFVVRRDRVYPAVAVPSPRAELSPADLVVMRTRALHPDAALRGAGAVHLDSILAAHPGTYDGPVAAMVDRRADAMVLAPGTYFDMLATCDALQAEWSDSPGPTPMRDLADALAGGDPLTSGSGRVAAAGVSVAVTVDRDGATHVLLGRRAAGVATDAGRWHVAPSGMVEPTHIAESTGALHPLVSSMVRELAEETGITAAPAPTLLGIGFDMLRLRPEVCLRVHLAGDVAQALTEEFDRSALVPLDPDALWAAHPPETLTPAAAATLALLEDRRG